MINRNQQFHSVQQSICTHILIIDQAHINMLLKQRKDIRSHTILIRNIIEKQREMNQTKQLYNFRQHCSGVDNHKLNYLYKDEVYQ